jgi:Rho GDP-dissociation inhibitor
LENTACKASIEREDHGGENSTEILLLIPNPPSPLLTHTTPLPDQNDESLRKWKESLGLGSGQTISDPNDPRKVILLSLGLEVEGRPDIIIDLTQTGALESLNKKPFTIKEGATFRMKARFRVQHDILSGMKYVQVVSRMGVKQKMQEMIVSSRVLMGCGLALLLCANFYARALTRPTPPTSPNTRRSVRINIFHKDSIQQADIYSSRARVRALRHDRPWPLRGLLDVHRRRQERVPEVQVVVRHQEGLVSSTRVMNSISRAARIMT